MKPDNPTTPEATKSPWIYKFLLMVLPVGVVIGTIVFMVMYFHMEREEQREHAVIVSHHLRVQDLRDMVDKFSDRIGERDIETEQGRVGLRRAASMIEGRLGPQNVGYPVTRCKGEAAYGRLWKSLSVEVRGQKTPEEVVFAAVSYAGPGGEADANVVSTLMMIASSVAREKPDLTLRFVFLPTDRPVEQQKRWLIERCLKPGEGCAGVLGLTVMESIPAAGEPEWQVTTGQPADEAWWAYLSGGSEEGKFAGGRMPSVWLTHPVFSPVTWTGKKEERLERTIEVAQEIRGWLLKAATR